MKYFNVMPDENFFVDKIFKWIIDVLVIVVLAFFCITFYFNQMKIEGNSMNDKLKNGDTVMVDTLTYNVFSPSRYDVIVFEKKQEDGDDSKYTKRIIAMPGETVQIKNGEIYVNDKKIDFNEGKDKIVNAGVAAEKIKLNKGEYFVIGDNWNNSEDSRANSILAVNEDEIIGKVWLISWPFARIKPV